MRTISLLLSKGMSNNVTCMPFICCGETCCIDNDALLGYMLFGEYLESVIPNVLPSVNQSFQVEIRASKCKFDSACTRLRSWQGQFNRESTEQAAQHRLACCQQFQSCVLEPILAKGSSIVIEAKATNYVVKSCSFLCRGVSSLLLQQAVFHCNSYCCRGVLVELQQKKKKMTVKQLVYFIFQKLLLMPYRTTRKNIMFSSGLQVSSLFSLRVGVPESGCDTQHLLSCFEAYVWLSQIWAIKMYIFFLVSVIA